MNACKLVENIKNNIIQFRENLGWSQSELAKQSGLTSSCICLIEKTGRAPSLTTLSKIARAFGLSISEIIQDTCLTDEKAVLYAKLNLFNYCAKKDQDLIVKIIKRFASQGVIGNIK